jgi:hypothetical protein
MIAMMTRALPIGTTTATTMMIAMIGAVITVMIIADMETTKTLATAVTILAGTIHATMAIEMGALKIADSTTTGISTIAEVMIAQTTAHTETQVATEPGMPRRPPMKRQG